MEVVVQRQIKKCPWDKIKLTSAFLQTLLTIVCQGQVMPQHSALVDQPLFIHRNTHWRGNVLLEVSNCHLQKERTDTSHTPNKLLTENENNFQTCSGICVHLPEDWRCRFCSVSLVFWLSPLCRRAVLPWCFLHHKQHLLIITARMTLDLWSYKHHCCLRVRLNLYKPDIQSVSENFHLKREVKIIKQFTYFVLQH